MKKFINLMSMLQAAGSLDQGSFEAYKSLYGIDIKAEEIEDVRELVSGLVQAGCETAEFEGFHVGYKIPQIGKEFDLLRFSHESLLNIEVKRKADEEKVHSQLLRNKFYLDFIEGECFQFSYVSETKTLYRLADDGDLEVVGFDHLLEVIRLQQGGFIESVDELFEPSNYLVSPFNSTDKFLAGEFFLTHQQEEAQSGILKSLENKMSPQFFSISGAAGTGKTLLAYSVAREAISKGKNVLVVHCGLLNSGHHKLLEEGWSVRSIKSIGGVDFSKVDLVIVDESQRLKENQFGHLVKGTLSGNGVCVFSFDRVQTLATHEEQVDVAGKVNALQPLISYSLSEKVRTNKQIADFIRMLVNNKRNIKLSERPNVDLRYFSDVKTAKHFLTGIVGGDWQVLRMTPSQYNSEFHGSYSIKSCKTSHAVIGQEFDNVAVVMDEKFYYAEGGHLRYNSKTYYLANKMLLQNLTRARKRLMVVVVGNPEIMNRCLSILQ